MLILGRVCYIGGICYIGSPLTHYFDHNTSSLSSSFIPFKHHIIYENRVKVSRALLARKKNIVDGNCRQAKRAEQHQEKGRGLSLGCI